MATLNDVKHWYMDAGIGHIVIGGRWSPGTLSGWNYTACGSMSTGTATREIPRRKCRRCMALLKDLTVLTGEGPPRPG